MWFRQVARAKSAPLPLVDERIAVHLWQALWRTFPEVATAVLTRDRLEMIPRGSSARKVRAKLTRVLAELPRLIGNGVPPPVWEPIELPRPIVGPEELDRHLEEITQEAIRIMQNAPVPDLFLHIPDELLADMAPLLHELAPYIVSVWPDEGPSDPTVN